MATHSSILAWRIPMDRGAWRATVHRVAKSRARPRGLAHTPGDGRQHSVGAGPIVKAHWSSPSLSRCTLASRGHRRQVTFEQVPQENCPCSHDKLESLEPLSSGEADREGPRPSCVFGLEQVTLLLSASLFLSVKWG